MVRGQQEPMQLVAASAQPRIVFVLGKGGVGRSTVAAALASSWARREAHVLILQWAITDPIGPWFGTEPAGALPVTVAPGVDVVNFSLDYALRAYFVDHLNAGWLYRRVIRARPVARLLKVAPGLAEMFFIGQLWWLTNLAASEAGLRYDRIVVDAPATGHGSALLDVPATMATMRGADLFALESQRVADMMADPTQIGAVIVALPEALVVRETLELHQRVLTSLGRAPLAALVNRSAASLVAGPAPGAWLDRLTAQVSPANAQLIAGVHRELRTRLDVETQLRSRLDGATEHGVDSFAELPGRTPRQVIAALADQLGGTP